MSAETPNNTNPNSVIMEALKNFQIGLDEIRRDIGYQIRPGSIYYQVSELFELYRLTVKNRISCLMKGPRKAYVKTFIDELKKPIQCRRNAKQLDYVIYYRYNFPEELKPSDEDLVSITIERDGERLVDVNNLPVDANVNARVLFWNLTEWRNVGDLSFLESDRQRMIITNILRSLSESLRMALWEDIKLGKEINETLFSIDKEFIAPVEFRISDTEPLKFQGSNTWLKEIAFRENW